MAINVFLSVGRTFNSNQEEFISALETHLNKYGMRPQTVGRNQFTHGQPLQLITQLMDKSAGAIVVALERVRIENAKEFRGSSSEKSISNEALCTPWNQIEAALAFSRGLPLLVLREKSVRQEGLIDRSNYWYVNPIDVNPEYIATPEFEGQFKSWIGEVHKKAGWYKFRRA